MQPILLNWAANNFYGWGIVGLNLLLHWGNDSDIRTLMGFPIAEGDVVHLFDRDRQKYVLHPYEEGKWKSGPPLVSIGESFWIAKTEPGNWTKALSISE